MYYLLINSEASFQVFVVAVFFFFLLVMLLNVTMGGNSICSPVLPQASRSFAILHCIVTNTVPNQRNDCKSLQWCPDSGRRWVCREQITKQKNTPAFQSGFCFGRQLLGNECSWRWQRKLLQHLNSLSNPVNHTNSGTRFPYSRKRNVQLLEFL